uniref:Casein beta n=1 Tax=Otolemur garnettii TaxID=30611 RepID=H0XHD7_OTOGA
MKVLILACVVALALAREKEDLSVSSETVENLSRNEEFITHKQKIEKVKHEEQQQMQDELQDKIIRFFQPPPVVVPFPQQVPYAVLAQNALPLPQVAMALPALQPEIVELPKAKETSFPKHKAMPFIKSPAMPFFEPQNLNLKPLVVQLLQPAMPQVPQTHAFPPQPLWAPAQPKVAFPEQLALQPQNARPVQALLPNQDFLVDLTRQLFPATQQLYPLNQ